MKAKQGDNKEFVPCKEGQCEKSKGVKAKRGRLETRPGGVALNHEPWNIYAWSLWHDNLVRSQAMEAFFRLCLL